MQIFLPQTSDQNLDELLEVDKPGLVRVDRQPVLVAPLWKNGHHTPCVFLVLEHDRKVVGVAHQASLATQPGLHVVLESFV